VASRTDESAELNRQLDVADADIVLVQKTPSNRSLMLGPYMYILNVDGVAAVENLRAELARAK